MREGLTQLIGQEDDLAVCGEAFDAAGAVKAIGNLMPDIVIVDVSLKDSSGIELIKDIRVRWPNLPVLVFSVHDESLYAERILRAGARGYVTKAEAAAKLIEGIRRVLDGDVYVSEMISSKMLSRMVGASRDTSAFPLDTLTDREFEVFELIGKGLQGRQIAETLHLSVKTVAAHREHIKKKLNFASATELLAYAIRWTQLEGKA
jgi:DNA-binding NarL/FixJ family response regulator